VWIEILCTDITPETKKVTVLRDGVD